MFGVVLLVEAGLSFLGLGVQPPTASWGVMLRRVVRVHPRPPVGRDPGRRSPSRITVFCFNAVGDGLRAALGGA